MVQRDWTLAETKPLVEADITVLRAHVDALTSSMNGVNASIDDAVETANDARSSVDALTTTVGTKADSSTVTALTTTVGTKADSSTVTALSASNALKAPLANPTFTGTVALPASTNVTLGGTALSGTLALKAPLPSFRRFGVASQNTVSGLTTLTFTVTPTQTFGTPLLTYAASPSRFTNSTSNTILVQVSLYTNIFIGSANIPSYWYPQITQYNSSSTLIVDNNGTMFF